MNIPIIAMIGAGNMGSSLIGGLIKNGHPAEKIIATDPSEEKLSQLQKTFTVQVTSDNLAAVSNADVVIFAVKPQIFAEVATPLKSVIESRKPLIISIAAGIRASSIQNWVGGHAAVVRVMPNTPALIGAGASALFANSKTTEEQRNIAESIMRAVGIAVWVNDEKDMDTVTALSGSGPAYFFLILEALQDAAVDLGLPTETAQLLAQQTALGASLMAIDSNYSAAELRKHVTSPGGTTEKAVNVLEEHHVRDIFKKAVTAAKQRSEELANLLGDKK
ncbi:MAG TPA: pyrroline-5-carboxylate reductase [Gammaproteobacteria bacterium]|jgi:pyrroline-5-carboxylate reductase|nr:pyrroline-5-carboxylate reductase [Gammaproteobacteria bacterium]